MQNARRALVAIALLSATVAASAQSKNELQARYQALATAVERQDLTAISAIYVEDASLSVTMPDGHDRVRGVESIAGLWQGAIKGGAAGFEAKITSVTEQASVLLDVGTFVIKKKDGSPFAQGGYTAEWRKDGGVWKLVRHELIAR